MILSFSYQLWMFLAAVLTGVFLGLCYDLIRITRRIVKRGRLVIHIEDALYWIGAAALSFLVMLNMFNGEVRPFIIFAVLLGMVIYFSLPSVFIMALAEKLIIFIKKKIRIILKPAVRYGSKMAFPFIKLKIFLNKKYKKVLHLCKVYAKLKIRHFIRDIKSMMKK